jgi:hypothetical protein
MTLKDVLKATAKEPEAEREQKSGKEKYSAQKSREEERKSAPDLSQRHAPTKRTR